MCEDCLIKYDKDGSFYRGPCYVGGKSTDLLIGRYDGTTTLKSVTGKILFSNGAFFIGEVSGGKAYKGLLINGEDRYYYGELKENIPHGKGRLFQNGVLYEGTWDEGAGSDIVQKPITVIKRRSVEPNCYCGKSLLTELETILSTSTLRQILTNKEFDPTYGDFTVVFPDPMPDFFSSYITRYKSHLLKSSQNFEQYSRKPVSIECVKIETFVANNKSRLPKIKNGFIQEKDCILKVTYFKEATLETYDVFFYKFNKGFKIIQFQLFYG